MTKLDLLRRKLDRLLADREHASRLEREETARLKHAKRRLVATEDAQRLAQEIAKQVQHSAHAQIASVVNRCLEAVFREDALEFRIVFEAKRGRTEARLAFFRGEYEEEPLKASSGGQIDVAAFALRLVALVLTRPAPRRVLVLDEPFRWVNGEDYQSRVADMLTEVSRDLKVQLIISTDDDWCQLGKIVRL